MIMMNRTFLLVAGLLTSTPCTLAFSPAASSRAAHRHSNPAAVIAKTTSHDDARSAAPPAAGTLLRMSDVADDDASPSQERIRTLVESNSVLLFMKGSKLFPQCGFSNTACQILQSYGIDFQTVDVLADDEIRQGVKTYSQWPTIPQLYVCGEFIGGSDIMIEMYQSG
jgi:monothiol glutaredoxin